MTVHAKNPLHQPVLSISTDDTSRSVSEDKEKLFCINHGKSETNVNVVLGERKETTVVTEEKNMTSELDSKRNTKTSIENISNESDWGTKLPATELEDLIMKSDICEKQRKDEINPDQVIKSECGAISKDDQRELKK
ncbi:hypothetical protein CEXT_188151 [Caerostris extrusa]|uniref:Uncharacterized protein n=1 Tax=Caerostris extrusa TaxID=172846 RepID=A0AAV4TYG9_CAEEX|nr:hypothetical protein CEXT_188151 [Caerostris extrusa]